MSIQQGYDTWATTYDVDRNLTRDLDLALGDIERALGHAARALARRRGRADTLLHFPVDVEQRR